MLQKIRSAAIIAASILAFASPAAAQGTPMPVPLIQWLTNAGAVADTWGLCVFRAGTSTAASTYTTAALSVANANPVLFNSAGRATSGGVFLTPGQAYKFVLKDFTGVGSPTCIPDTGSTIWTVDNVPAVPGSAAAVDVTATAGESIAAGEAVYVSSGTGGLNQGQIYKTDSDLTYKSTSATMVGIAPSAIISGNDGTVRISGAVTVTGPLSAGAPYYAGATAGALVSTPPTNAIRIGVARSATSFIVGYTDAPVSPRGPPCGRLTLTTGVPVTTADVTAATTVYYTPYGGCNQIDLFDGTAWQASAFAEISIAVPATTLTIYDVFAYDNAGVVALELTAWTNDTTRATALVLQNGVYVKTGVLTRRYLGSFRTVSSGQTEDSGFTCVTTRPKRFLYNYYHRKPRPICHIDTTANWSYTTATLRIARAATGNAVEIVNGVAEDPIELRVQVMNTNATARANVLVAIGENSESTAAAGQIGGTNRAGVDGSNPGYVTLIAELRKVPPVGFSYYAWLEASEAAGTSTWYGAALLTGGAASGITGTVWQ